MKIQIVGYAASGKSTFAQRMKNDHALPLLHIDKIAFEPGWIEVERSKVEQGIRAFIEAHDSWIIDGLYRRLAVERFDQCDQLFIFDFNRFICLLSAIQRRIRYHNKERESIASGCKEKLDPSFIMWILFRGRTRKSKALFKSFKETYKDKVVVFKNRREVNRYLCALEDQNP